MKKVAALWARPAKLGEFEKKRNTRIVALLQRLIAHDRGARGYCVHCVGLFYGIEKWPGAIRPEPPMDPATSSHL